MSFYISDRQFNRGVRKSTTFVPVLLERVETPLQHRIYSDEFELSALLLDAYELSNRSGAEFYYPVLPSPTPCIYVKFSKSAAIGLVAGMATEMKKIQLPPEHTLFCVRFQPGILGSLTGQPAKNLTNLMLPLEHCFSQSARLLNQIRMGESFHERNVRIHQHIKAGVTLNTAAVHPLLTVCLRPIHERKGDIRIAELAELAGCSERYLGRIFQDHVGSSPKQYGEIVRMHFSLNEILTEKPKSLTRTAINYGYFDQTHMNRSYQKLLGRTASDMRFVDDLACETASMPLLF